MYDKYQSPLSERYASKEMQYPEESQELIRFCECATVVVCEDSAFRHCVLPPFKNDVFQNPFPEFEQKKSTSTCT